MKPTALALLFALAAGCALQRNVTVTRGTINLLNLHDQRIHRLTLTTPDLERTVFGLESHGSFAISDDISFRRPWTVTVELDDGSTLSATSGSSAAVAPVVEIRIHDDGQISFHPLPENPRGP